MRLFSSWPFVRIMRPLESCRPILFACPHGQTTGDQSHRLHSVPEAWMFIEIAAASPCGATLKFPSSAATNTCKSSKQSRGMACVASNRIRYGSRGRCILCVSAPGERPLQDLPLCSPGGAGRRTGCCVMVVMQDSHLRNITT